MRNVRTALSRRGVKAGLISTLVLLSFGGAPGIYGQDAAPRKLVWKRPASNERSNSQDTRTLSAKAKDSGRHVTAEYPPDLRGFNTLDALARGADIIVIATAVRNLCKLSADGRTVTIDYEMKVEHSYKGALAEGKTVSVSLPGGLARFADGTSAEVRTPWFKKMINGKTYLLFLNSRAKRPFTTTGGPRGVFEIPTSESYRTVSSHSLIEDDPMQGYNETDVIIFLRAVKQSVKRTR